MSPRRFSRPRFRDERLGQGEVFLDGKAFTGAGQWVLEYPGNPAGPFVGGQFGYVLVVHDDLATVYQHFASQGVQEGGFTGAVTANNRNKLALVDRQAHASERGVFQGGSFAEGESEVGCTDHFASSGLASGKFAGNG